MSESEHLVGLDRRGANGVLYGVGTASYLYSVTRQGRATRINPDPFEVSVQGASYGLDFDPASDRLRLVSDLEQNMRIDPGTGRVVDGNPLSSPVNPDDNLQFAQEDREYPRDPNVGAAAYARDGRLFGIDATRNSLVQITRPAEGEVRTLGPLGVRAANPVGFDIASDGVAYAAFRREGRREVELWRVNLSSGRATPAARRPAVGSHPTGRGRDPIVSLAAAGQVQDDLKGPRLRVLSGARLPVRRLLSGRAHVVRVRVSEPGRLRLRLYSGRRRVAGFAKNAYVAGPTSIRLRLTRRQRRIARGSRALRFTVNAQDAAGNVTHRRRP